MTISLFSGQCVPLKRIILEYIWERCLVLSHATPTFSALSSKSIQKVALRIHHVPSVITMKRSKNGPSRPYFQALTVEKGPN